MSRNVDLKLKGKWKFSKIYKAVWESPITHKGKLVFGALEWHGEKIFPSHRTLSRMTSLSVAGVKRGIKELQESGFLSWEKRDGITNEYELFPDGNQVQIDLGQGELGQPEPGDRSYRPNHLGQGDLHNDTKGTETKNKTVTPQGEFVDWFKTKYQIQFGKPYLDSKADYVKVAETLKIFQIETLKGYVPGAWAHKDQFIRTTSMTVKGFISVMNKLTAPEKKNPVVPGGPQDVGWLARNRAEREQRKAMEG